MPSVPGGAFPQIGDNRTVEQLVTEIGEHEGGAGLGDVRTVALHALKDAVRQFNTNAWKFNRRSQIITFLDNVNEYDLNTNWRSPLRAVLRNAAGQERFPLRWIPFEEKLFFFPSEVSDTNVPLGYTAFDTHGRGKIRYFGKLNTNGAGFSSPTVIHYYHQRIQLPAFGSKLDVPTEVEDAIYQLAVAKFVAKVRTFEEARTARNLADEARFEIERGHRDWGDIY